MWERLVKHLFKTVVANGNLSVTFPDGSTIRYGDGTGAPITLTFHDRKVFRKIALNPELSLPEAYVDGSLTIGNDDLYGFLTMAIQNLAEDHTTFWQGVLSHLRAALRGRPAI